MRKGKKYISLFLAIVMVFTILQAPIQLTTAVATGEDNNLTIDGATLSVSSDITVKYLLKKTAFDNAGYKDPYIEATYCGKTTKLDALVTSVSGIECYVFSFNNVAPHKMNDSIYTVLYAQKDGELCVGQTHEYSVAKYAYSKLATTTDPYFRTMLVDMLNYGAAAQKYMNYNVNALVNADLTEKQQSYGTQNLRELTTVKYLPTAEASDKANWVGLGLYLENKVAIRGYFDTDLTNGIYVKVTDEAGKTLGTVPYSDLTTAIGPDNTPVYTFIFDGLNVSQMSKVVKFSICDANNNTISRAYTYSIESYVYTSKDSSVEKLANLTKEMIKYGDAAEKYVSSRGTIFGNMTVADLGEVMYARIVNTGTNTTLDVSGEDVLLKTSAGEIGQIWKFEQNSDGTYTIINQANGKMLNVDNGAEASGANISVCTRTDAVSGKWYILTDGKDYAFMPVYSDAYVMSVADNNAFLEAYTKSGLNYKFNILKLIIENNRENVIWNTTPAIPADSGNVIKLSDYHIQFAQNENITAASEITWTSDELEITNNKVTIPSKGVYKLTAKSGTKTKTVYIIAKNVNEAEYVLYYNDFSSSNLSDFRSFSGDGNMSVSNGRLVLSGKKCILLPEYIGDFADYTITSNATITAANNNTRWMGIMYRKLDGSAPYYQFSTRKNAADERGIELVENNGFGTWTYQQVGSFSEAISATKLYPYKIMVYDDTVKAYINNTLLMSYNNLSSRTGDVGLQVSDCTTEFDYLKVDLNFDIIYNYVRLAQLYSEKPVDLGADFYARFAESKSGKSLVASNDNVVIGAMSKDTNQIWRFTRNSNGSYRICHVSKNMYLSTNNSSSTAGTNVLLRAYSDSSDQAWFIYEQNNCYILVPSCSYDVAMDLAAGITTNGNNIQLWTYNDDDDNAKYFDILKESINNNIESVIWYDTPAIPVNVGETVDLDNYSIQYAENSRLFSSLNINWNSDEVTIVDNKIKINAKGVYKLVATSGTRKANVYVIAKAPTETEYVLYYNDFSSNDLSDFNLMINSGSANVSDGKLYLDGEIKALMPNYLADFYNYTISSNATLVSGESSGKWFSFMYRLQNEHLYYHYIAKVGTTASNGIIHQLRETSSTWSYQAQTPYSEALNASKNYLFKLEAYGNTAGGYINNQKLLRTHEINALSKGKLGLQVFDVKVAFDDIKVSVDFNKVYDYMTPNKYQALDNASNGLLVNGMADFSILASTKGYTLSVKSTKLAVLAKTSEFTIAQGCCSDGEYVYGVIRNSDDSGAIIRKHKLSDGSYVATSAVLNLGHGNDLTYDSKNNRIVVARGQSLGNGLLFVDPDTLTVTGSVTIDTYAGAITYNEKYDCYAISRGGKTLEILNSNFEVIKSYTRTDSTGYTAQGMGSDDNYIYFPMSYQDKKNVIVVYDWYGNYIMTIQSDVTREAESMFWVNGKYYFAHNYYLEGMNVWETDLKIS